MFPQNNNNTPQNIEYTALPAVEEGTAAFPVRTADNQKMDVADLFTHFTASIIQQDTTFTR